MKCPACQGLKFVSENCVEASTGTLYTRRVKCRTCHGKGEVMAPAGGPPELAQNTMTGEEMAEANKNAHAKKIHPFLAAKLYEPCPVCKGTKKTLNPAMVDGVPTKDGKNYTGPLPVGSDCPMCEPSGFVEVGLTVGQLERFRALSELFADFLYSLTVMADVDAPRLALGGVVFQASDLLNRFNASEITAARARVEAAMRKAAGG